MYFKLAILYLLSLVKKGAILVKFYLLLKTVSMVICKEDKSRNRYLMSNNYKIAAMFALTRAPTVEDLKDTGEINYKLLYISKNKIPLLIENNIDSFGIEFIDLSDLDKIARVASVAS